MRKMSSRSGCRKYPHSRASVQWNKAESCAKKIFEVDPALSWRKAES